MIEQKESRLKHMVVEPVRRFLHLNAAGGILLFSGAVIAFVWANSPWRDVYFSIWEIPVTAGFGDFSLKKPLLLWINDGLMAVFFFVVGLEVKREILAGELSNVRKAILPVAAAIGGMVVPAAIYLGFNQEGPGRDGWGIPMATDIAFALGILSLFGSRVPLGLKVFLTALAIADDIGAVLVIALFYSSKISIFNLVIGAIFLTVMFIFARIGVRNPLPFALLGIGGLWLAFLLSGVHATVAGVLAAFAIPATVRIRRDSFVSRLTEEVDRLRGSTSAAMLSHDEQHTIERIERASEDVQPPLQRIEHGLHPWVMYVIMPIFALANAGVSISADSVAGDAAQVVLGIVFGLVVGKLVGVAFFAWVTVRFGWADLPEGANWGQVIGVALLAGVGFTMSLFIGGLAFTDPALGDAAKVGILAASVIAGVVGSFIIWRSSQKADVATEGN